MRARNPKTTFETLSLRKERVFLAHGQDDGSWMQQFHDVVEVVHAVERADGFAADGLASE
jgi:hypothetical protein